jgi:hypothetical protein
MYRLPGIAAVVCIACYLLASAAQARCHREFLDCESTCPSAENGTTTSCAQSCRSFILVCETFPNHFATSRLPQSALPGSRLPQGRLPASHLPASLESW